MTKKEVRLGEIEAAKLRKDWENSASWLLDDLPKNGNIGEGWWWW
jgi:hypothetical protein